MFIHKHTKSDTVRHEKDLANMAKASGDDDLRREAQYKINLLTNKYAQLSKASGLPTKMERMQVGGFRRVKEKIPLTKSVNGGIINNVRGGIDMLIDKFTPCLEDAKSGEILATSFSLVSKEDLRRLKGWKFNWTDSSLSNAEIYKLTIEGDSEIQGLIALTKFERDKAVYVNIVESAPHNLGKNKQYNGVGGHLYAIAAQKSVENGYGGFVFMDAKNMELVEHYRKTLGAVLLGRPHEYRMFIDEVNAQELLKIYTLTEG